MDPFHWSDEEATYSRQVIRDLERAGWAQVLLRRIRERGGVVPANSALLFEARVAVELWRRGYQVQYEHRTDVDETSVDFHVAGDPDWLIEVVSLQESDAFRNATTTVEEEGVTTSVTALKTPGDEDREEDTQAQSTEAEMIRAQERIVAKVFDGLRPIKFPEPRATYHAVVVDTRGLLWGKADEDDYRQLTHGSKGVPPERVLYWGSCSDHRGPILGLFEHSNPLVGSRYIRQRIHIITFVGKVGFSAGQITDHSRVVSSANRTLFRGKQEETEIFRTYPLRPSKCVTK